MGEATVKNHGRYLAIFLNYAATARGKAIETVIQDFMLEIKRTKANETYKNYLATLKIPDRAFGVNNFRVGHLSRQVNRTQVERSYTPIHP